MNEEFPWSIVERINSFKNFATKRTPAIVGPRATTQAPVKVARSIICQKVSKRELAQD